ncbi:hypothetical protein CNEO3_50061 [Clostridium neonatale]|nr:hypothetical protein CNEO3_50061 [Clostridium neonatale]
MKIKNFITLKEGDFYEKSVKKNSCYSYCSLNVYAVIYRM